MIVIHLSEEKLAENITAIAVDILINNGGTHNMHRAITQAVQTAIDRVARDWNVPTEGIDTILIYKMVELKWRRLNG